MSERGDSSADPTPRDRRQAREEGRVVCSREIVFALGFSMAGLTLWLRSRWLFQTGTDLMRLAFLRAPRGGAESMLAISQEWIGQFLLLVAPGLVIIGVTVVLAHWIQHGPLWLPHRLIPDVGRLSSARIASRLASGDVLASLIIGTIKLAMMIATLGWVVSRNVDEILSLGMVSADRLVLAASPLVVRSAGGVAVALLLSAAVDFAYRLFRHETSLRELTPQREAIKPLHNDLVGRRRK